MKMRNIFANLLCMLAFMSVYANEEGHFFVDLSSQNVALTNVADSFRLYFDFANGSSFALFRDTIDAIGIRHQSYQQYYQGAEVESHVVLVHSKDGIVSCINGSAMIQSQTPQSVETRISRSQAAAKAPKKVEEKSITSVIICIDGMYYSVYKVPSPETFEILYVDSNTGEIIYRESVFRNADVVGRGYTRYQGWQNMTVYENVSKYYLMDQSRNIVTLSAESASPNYDYYSGSSYINTLPQEVQEILRDTASDLRKEYLTKYIYSPLMADYINNSCRVLSAEEIDFYTPRIKSITISSAATSWWYDLWDTKPDLYCKICDPNGNVLYTTNTKDDCTLPVTFTFTKGIAVTKGCSIEIYDEDATSDSYGGSVSLTTTTPGVKTWSGSNTSGSIEMIDSPMEFCDIHWGMQMTLDFYQTTFNRNSFDGNGHVVINLAFPPKDNSLFKDMPNNAAAQHTFEPYFMYYGKGDGLNMYPVASLDVMAHEFTHMVTGTNGNGGLDYKLESGALNESFSDIMAMGVMQYALGTCSWTIGADVMINKPNIRSMSNPKNSLGANGDTLYGAQPDTYKGQCWSFWPANKDKSGIVVHRNSGVQNYWFYLLSEGGNGTNDYSHSYNVSGIGMNKALDISYRNLLFYLAPNATFEDARNGSIQAAIDLYGRGSQEHQSVVNAWYAVGVGDKYQEVDCKSVPYTESFAASQGDFSVVNLTLPSGFTSIWNWNAQYGMVAKCIKGSTKYESESWLISPCIELPADKSCVVSFSHAAKFFQDTKQMSMWISANYDESAPEDAQWTRLVIPTYPTGNNWNWFDSGEIDLSEYKGQNVNIAFCYKSNANYAPQWEIKNFAIKEVVATAVENTFEHQSSATKILRDGQIFILRGDKTYTLTGQEIN